MSKDKSQKKPGTFVRTLDHVVGDIVLGGVGRIGYHVGQMPGVGATGEYVRKHVSTGFQEAAGAAKRRSMAKDIAELMRSKNVSSDTIRAMCLENEIPEDQVKEVEQMARDRAGKGVKAGEVPLPAGA